MEHGRTLNAGAKWNRDVYRPTMAKRAREMQRRENREGRRLIARALEILTRKGFRK